MDRALGMAMDGYISASEEEENAMRKYFLLPDMQNHLAFVNTSKAKSKMLHILLDRHADYIIHIVEEYRSSIGREIDLITIEIQNLNNQLSVITEELRNINGQPNH